jgi:putative tricarboxylic transport membrane protein
LFGIVGYLMKKIAIEPARIVPALVLGYFDGVEFRRALLGSDGDFTIFVTGRYLCYASFWL